jgi:hypothetical protein
MTMAESSSQASSADWRITVAVVAVLIGGALLWRGMGGNAPSNEPPPSSQPKMGEYPGPLPRTRKLVIQKLGSLEAYNNAIAQADQLKEFSHWTGEREVELAAFEEMSRLMLDRIVPDLWREAQAKVGNGKMVTQKAMSHVIHHRWPQKLLPNGHVVLFPAHARLRMVASERMQDYFRDTGWHWRWIGQAIERDTITVSQAGELNIYAAEELSEFLSVLAVGMLEWSANVHEPPLPRDIRISGSVMKRALDIVQLNARDSLGEERKQVAFWSALTQEALLKGVSRPMFREVSQRVGLKYVHAPDPALDARRSELYMPTGIAGGGVSAGDFDGDGFADLYFAGGGGGSLCRNVEGKQFVDVSGTAGLAREGETRAGYFVDYDNDGDLDLFLTFVFKPNRLYRNEGGGKFTDVTKAAGIGGGELVTHEAVWFDYDNDGLLDVYVANFGMWPNGENPDLKIKNRSAPPNQLYHHRVVEGKHIFEEVAAKLGVDDRGWTHCVGAWDFDQDGWMDLISLNDFGQTIAFHNKQGKRFTEGTRTLHLDTVYNAMNFELIDLEHNGNPAIYVTEISKLTHRVRYPVPGQGTKIKFDHLENMRTLVVNKLLRRRTDGAFENVHDIHIEPAQMGWAWDASTFDYENDGDLDLLVLNGTVGKAGTGATGTHTENLSRHAQQNNVCFLSQDRYFYDVSAVCELSYRGNSRSSAWFDFDNDGDLDVAINDYKGRGRIYENAQATGNHYLRVRLRGTRANRNAIGARVEVRFGDEKRFAQVVSGKGFLSQNPMTLHFGLGKVDKVEKVLVTWPGDTDPTAVISDLIKIDQALPPIIEQPSK